MMRLQKCQSAAWKEIHKHECKIFKHQPGPFPGHLNATYPILEGIQQGLPAYWGCLDLQSYVEDQKRNSQPKYDKVEILAYGPWKFAGEPVPLGEAIHIMCTVSLTLPS